MATLDVKSAVTGTVVQISVQEGAQVTADDEIAVLESMKMETPVLAGVAGQVTFRVREGEAVEENQVIAVIQT